MNAPFHPVAQRVRLADLSQADERHRYAAFLAAHPQATAFHAPEWIEAVAHGTGNRAHLLLAEGRAGIAAALPLNEIHSPVFGRLLASTGFGVDGGLLAGEGVEVGCCAHKPSHERYYLTTAFTVEPKAKVLLSGG